MVRTYYLLEPYRNQPLPQSVIDDLQNDFATAREAGVKIVLRFAYNFGIGEPDAPLDRVVQHIDQLTPVIRRNADVIAFMEAGFIGAWGEWHNSTNNLIGSGGVNANTRAITDRLLAALPQERAVAVRTPRYKQQLTGDEALLNLPDPAPALLEVPTRYARVELRAVADETLVTAIELLSPANKRPTPDGADAYEQKRQDLFRSGVHLLEIDLLRGGRRPRLARPDPLPPTPYFVFLSRAERWPEIAIWMCTLEKSLPTVPVPLRRPDPDTPLPLTQLLHQVYRNARYDLRIDYRQPPPPPDLTPDEAAWLDAHLHACGLRP